MPVATYQLLEREYETGIKYYFISVGKGSIIKAIDYSYVTQYQNNSVYNLAFGDYNVAKDKLDDDINSDNGDVYKVFYTVLSSIQRILQIKPTAMIMVTGSDSKSEFAEKCILTCIKNCSEASKCKNKDRRISVYRRYVNKNYNELSVSDIFKGGIITKKGIEIEDYNINKDYGAVFVKQK